MWVKTPVDLTRNGLAAGMIERIASAFSGETKDAEPGARELPLLLQPRRSLRGDRYGRALTSAELRKLARPVRNGKQQDGARGPVPSKRSYPRGWFAADRAGGSLPRETYWRPQP